MTDNVSRAGAALALGISFAAAFSTYAPKDSAAPAAATATTPGAPNAPAAPGAVSPEMFYKEADGDDWAPAFERMWNSPPCTKPALVKFHTRPPGCQVQLGCRAYPVSRTVRLCRPHTLQGCGGAGWSPGTVIHSARDVTALRVAYADECKAASEGRDLGGGNAVIRDLAVVSAGRTSTSAQPRFGIQFDARAVVERVWVRNFTIGFSIAADIHTQPYRTNANVTRLWAVLADGSEHAGIRFKGGDSNAGGVWGGDFSSNCQRASQREDGLGAALEARFGRCANLIDDSFLGNMLSGIHAASAFDTKTRERFPCYRFGSANQHTVLAGGYAELNCLAGELGKNTIALGGHAMNWSGLGLRMDGTRMNSLRVIGADGQGFMAGDAAGGMAAFLHPRAPAWLMRIKAGGPGNNYYRVDLGNLDAVQLLRVGANHDAGFGDVWVRP